MGSPTTPSSPRTVTSKQPLRGLSPFTSTWTVAGSFSARSLRTCAGGGRRSSARAASAPREQPTRPCAARPHARARARRRRAFSARVLNAPQDLHASMWTRRAPAGALSPLIGLGAAAATLVFAFFVTPFEGEPAGALPRVVFAITKSQRPGRMIRLAFDFGHSLLIT